MEKSIRKAREIQVNKLRAEQTVSKVRLDLVSLGKGPAS